MSYATDGTMGVNLTQVDTSASHTVGTQVVGNEASKWMYIEAASGISQYDVVMINTSSKGVPITTTNAASGVKVGFAQTSIASGKYAWVALEGTNLSANLLVNCAPHVRLYTTATAGKLDDTIVSAGQVAGVEAQVTAATSGTTSVRIVATNPFIHNQSTT